MVKQLIKGSTVTWPEIHFAICLCARFKASHTLYIGKPFNRFLGISNTRSNLGFGTPLHHHLILLGFSMLILWVVELIEKNTFAICHFLGSSLICLSSHK
jgi:hypothetical protein